MNKSGFFTTKTGLGILALLLFIAVYKGYYFAVTIFVVLLLLFLAAPFAARISSRKVEAGLKREVCLFPGSDAKFEIEIENRKLLPVVQLTASLNDDIFVCADWVKPFEKLVCTKSFSAEKRGVIKADRIKIIAKDAFGLSESEAMVKGRYSNNILVYPKAVSVNTEPLLRRMSELEKSKNGFYTDKTLVNSVAAYTDGMSYKDVNQRLLARTDEMYVNVYEKLAMRRVCIVADFESFVSREDLIGPNGPYVSSVLDEAGFEYMLSAIGSLAMELSRKDVVCTVVLPSYGEIKEKIIVPQTIEEQIPLILRALAGVEYKTQETKLAAGLLYDEIHRLGKILVFTKYGCRVLFQEDPSADELGLEYISEKDISGYQ